MTKIHTLGAVTSVMMSLALLSGLATANQEIHMNYPETRRGEAIDLSFGERIADPYRWLENHIRSDREVAAWVEAQQEISATYLAGLPGRDVFRKRLKAVFDHERLTVPEKRGDRYFFTRNPGLDKQAVLVVRTGAQGADRTVIDPNLWSQDGTTALVEWAPSQDGTRIAYAVQESGADWRTIRVLDVDSGATLDDEIRWARFTSIAWTRDGAGFFYARNPEPPEGAAFETPVLGHSVYFHKLGTPQSDDRLIHVPETRLPAIHTVEATPDGRYLVIYSTALRGGNALSIVDLSASDWPVRSVVAEFDTSWWLAGNVGTRLFLVTQKGAQRGRLVTADLADTSLTFDQLVPEREDAVLRLAAIVGNRLILSYLVDAKTEVERYTLSGEPDGRVELPGIGSAGAFHGRPGDDEAFFVFTSHDAPTSIYRYEVAKNERSIWAEPSVALDLDRIRVEQRFSVSADGTQVPVFVVRRVDVTGPAPTMLTAYGGFGIPMVPFYSPPAMAWVEQGGVYAVANIRGGGEYGRAWHDGGRGLAKQNSFDDFIAAAELLMSEGITPPNGLAIHGESNGGLLVGVVVNQRPDLFAAALPGVGVMDMLRFDRFTGGQLWTQEFGSPAVEADFRNLLSYSPLHNVGSGTIYPAILVTTADTDDRVVPAHSFKYLAALQAADLGPHPRLLRVDLRAGHGAGKPIDKAIEELADQWAFAARWTNLDVKAPA